MEKTLRELLQSSGAEPRLYSGRGMCGSTCVSITGPFYELQRTLGGLVSELIEEARGRGSDETEGVDANINDLQKLGRTLLNYRSDQMGRSDLVYYWPSEKWVEEKEEECLDDEIITE